MFFLQFFGKMTWIAFLVPPIGLLPIWPKYIFRFVVKMLRCSMWATFLYVVLQFFKSVQWNQINCLCKFPNHNTKQQFLTTIQLLLKFSKMWDIWISWYLTIHNKYHWIFSHHVITNKVQITGITVWKMHSEKLPVSIPSIT